VRGAAAVVVCGSLVATAAVTAVPVAHAARTCYAGVLHPVGTQTVSFAAEVTGRTATYRRPRGPLVRMFPRLTGLGYPTTFSIVGAILNARCEATWYRVKLPMRPNGRVGYVRSGDVAVAKVATRISVDLSRRELALYRRGRLVLTTPVAVGSPTTRTPIGRYYVDQRITTRNAGGPFGPAVLGVSAFSGAMRGAPIGIHGTNAPWSIGRAASHGCIRVPNATLTRLFAATPAGTPVVIHP
jgi:lipoprotein-anchoring transpeptidase ErfK/SrfK